MSSRESIFIFTYINEFVGINFQTLEPAGAAGTVNQGRWVYKGRKKLDVFASSWMSSLMLTNAKTFSVKDLLLPEYYIVTGGLLSLLGTYLVISVINKRESKFYKLAYS